VAAVFYVVGGALHFIRPEPYLKTMTPYIRGTLQWCGSAALAKY
jgi:hypothetical protein